MRPMEGDISPSSDLEWEFWRAFNIFHFIFTQDERAEIFAESFRMGVNYNLVIYRHVKKRYPDLGWTDEMNEGMILIDDLLRRDKE